jgi:peroxiredoxin
MTNRSPITIGVCAVALALSLGLIQVPGIAAAQIEPAKPAGGLTATVKAAAGAAQASALAATVPTDPAAAAPVATEAGAPGSAAPAFALADQDGKTVRLADFAGKIVVLEWTNDECPYVKHHGARGTMKALAEKYRERGVVWLAVNSTKHATREKDREWIAQNKLPYPVLEDFEGTTGKAYGAKTTPHMFVIDASGRIAYAGAIDDDARLGGKPTVNYVEQALAELTAGKAVSTARTNPYGCSVKYKQ